MNSRKQSVIACVTGQFSCERVIKAAKAICDNTQAELTVVSVMNFSNTNRYEEQAEALEYLHSVCRAIGAEMTILYSENPVSAVAEYIKYKQAPRIIAGQPGKEEGFLTSLAVVFPDIDITIIPVQQDDGEDDVGPSRALTRFTRKAGAGAV